MSVEIIVKKKNLVFDATLLTALMGCGRFVDFRFNMNLVPMGGKSNSLEAGSIVHKILEVYYKSLINRHTKKDAIANGMAAGETYISGCQFCTDFIPTCTVDITKGEKPETHNHTEQCQIKPKCGHPINEFPGVKNTPPDSDKFHTGWKHVLSTCEEYFDFYKNDHWVPLETEVVKREIIYEDDEIRVLWKAKLDLTVDTNQGIYPADHKTMKQRRDTVSLNNQFMGQSVIMKSKGTIINKIGFQTSLKPEEKFLRSLVSYSADRLIEWQSEIVPYWAYQYLQYAETGYWTPNFQQCEGKYGNCVFKSVCESDRNLREAELKMNFIVGPVWDPE